MERKGKTFEELFGKEKADEIKSLLREKAKKQHLDGKYKPAERCSNCKCWMGKEHNCDEVRKNKSVAALNNPRRYWLGKKRPDVGEKVRLAFLKNGSTNNMKGKSKLEILHGDTKKLEEITSRTKETKKRKFLSGEIKVWNKGLTKDKDERIRLKEIKHSETILKKYQDKEYKERVLTGQFKTRKMTSYEKRLQDIITRNNLDYKFVGLGEIFIGGRVPDFVNCNGKKILIEVYEEYYKNHFFGSVENYEKKRFKHFKEYGWNTVFISGKELSDESKVIEKIKNEEDNFFQVRKE